MSLSDIIARLLGYNNRPVSVANPLGFDQGGYEENLYNMCADVADATTANGEFAQTCSDAATSASASAAVAVAAASSATGNVYLVALGSGGAYTAAMPTSPGGYSAGIEVSFKANHTNTGAASLDLNGLGARAIKYGGAALIGGEIPSGQVVTVVDDGTAFQLMAGGKIVTGQANGVAGLGADGKVPTAQLPAVSNANLLADTSASPNSYVLTPSPAKAGYSTDDIFYMQARAGIADRTGTVPSGYQVTTVNGNASITFTQGTTSGLAVGMVLAGTGIPGGTTIQSITDQTHLVMSANATASNSGVALTVTKGVTGTISGGTTVTLTSGTTANLLPGMYVTGSGIPASTQILSVQDSTHFTLSNVSTNASGIAITATIPVVAITLASGTTSGLSVGYSITGSIIPSTNSIASIVDSTHLLCSAVPASGTAVALAFNSGTNTGACTVNVSGLGAKSIKLLDGTDPLPGHIRAGGIYALKPDGTNVQLLNRSDAQSGLNNTSAYNAAMTFSFVQGLSCPSTVTRVFVQCYGGGGGGGNSASWAMGGGGGGYAEGWVTLTAGQSVTVTVGAGGGAGGGNGGTSSFGSYVSAAPGTGGGPAGGSPGSGGSANVGSYTIAGSSGSGSTGGNCNGPGGGAGGSPPNNGTAPGGGGGAGNTSNPNTPGTGGVGRVVISW